MSEETIRNSLITIGKKGFSAGTGEGGDETPCLYFRLGENSFITNGQTLSFSRKLNSLCYFRKMNKNSEEICKKSTKYYINKRAMMALYRTIG